MDGTLWTVTLDTDGNIRNIFPGPKNDWRYKFTLIAHRLLDAQRIVQRMIESDPGVIDLISRIRAAHPNDQPRPKQYTQGHIWPKSSSNNSIQSVSDRSDLPKNVLSPDRSTGPSTSHIVVPTNQPMSSVPDSPSTPLPVPNTRQSLPSAAPSILGVSFDHNDHGIHPNLPVPYDFELKILLDIRKRWVNSPNVKRFSDWLDFRITEVSDDLRSQK